MPAIVIRPPFNPRCEKCLDDMTDILYVLKVGRKPENARRMLRDHVGHMRRSHASDEEKSGVDF